MKKLLGLLAIAPMAVTACTTKEEVAATPEVEETIYDTMEYSEYSVTVDGTGLHKLKGSMYENLGVKYWRMHNEDQIIGPQVPETHDQISADEWKGIVVEDMGEKVIYDFIVDLDLSQYYSTENKGQVGALEYNFDFITIQEYRLAE